MLERITNFFRTFFGLIFGDLRKLFSPKKRKKIVIVEPDPEDLEPQDGGDIPQDTVVVANKNLDDLIVAPKPAEPDPVPEPIEESVIIPPQPEPEEGGFKPRYLWCLDNGHGKLTAGKRSPKLSNGDRFYEYEFNRIIVKGIIKELKKRGVKYYNVVPEANVDDFLKGRVLRANNAPSTLPKIYLSIHSNAGPGNWTSAKGLETWHYYRSRSGARLAAVFQKKLVEKLGWFNRGIKSQSTKQFFVLRKTSMPAILTESGFYNNRKEVYLLLKEETQERIINAHVEAIMYFERHGI